jgi:hypothetical protein
MRFRASKRSAMRALLGRDVLPALDRACRKARPTPLARGRARVRGRAQIARAIAGEGGRGRGGARVAWSALAGPRAPCRIRAERIAAAVDLEQHLFGVSRPVSTTSTEIVVAPSPQRVGDSSAGRRRPIGARRQRRLPRAPAAGPTPRWGATECERRGGAAPGPRRAARAADQVCGARSRSRPASTCRRDRGRRGLRQEIEETVQLGRLPLGRERGGRRAPGQPVRAPNGPARASDPARHPGSSARAPTRARRLRPADAGRERGEQDVERFFCCEQVAAGRAGQRWRATTARAAKSDNSCSAPVRAAARWSWKSRQESFKGSPPSGTEPAGRASSLARGGRAT